MAYESAEAEMDSTYSNLVAECTKAILSDDDDQSEMLANLYLDANHPEKEMLDRAFTCLCGWSLGTLMDRCVQGQGEDTTSPDWWSRQ